MDAGGGGAGVYGGGGGKGVDFFLEVVEKRCLAFLRAAARSAVYLLFKKRIVRDGEIIFVAMREEGYGHAVADGAGFGIGNQHDQRTATLHTAETAFSGEKLFVNVDCHSENPSAGDDGVSFGVDQCSDTTAIAILDIEIVHAGLGIDDDPDVPDEAHTFFLDNFESFVSCHSGYPVLYACFT